VAIVLDSVDDRSDAVDLSKVTFGYLDCFFLALIGVFGFLDL